MAAMTQLMFTLLAIVKAIQCACYSTTLTATTAKTSKSHYPFSNNEDCTFTIKPQPPWYLSSGNYYLEITWSSFSVNGDMPSCYGGDYVEVFLTSSYQSIGKYCSNNAIGKPFQMYSHDGYARIRFKSNGYSTSSGFRFYYQLKRYSDEIQSTSPSSTDCRNKFTYSTSNEIYSSGWPNGYARSSSPCQHTVSISSTYDETRFVFMDISLKTSTYGRCFSSSDSVKLEGSSTRYGYKSYISGALCRNKSVPYTYTTKYRYLKLTFNRPYGGRGNRGFVAGYISYWRSSPSNKDYPSSSGSSIASSIIGKVVGSGIFIVFIIIVGGVIRHKQAQRRRELHTQMLARGTVVPPCTQNTTVISSTQNTSQPAASYPMATYPTATYPAATYPATAYPNDSYPTSCAPSVYPGSDNAPPAYHAIANQPYPASQPPISTANQGQYPPDQTLPVNQQHTGQPYPPPGDATIQNAGGLPTAAPYPPPPTVAFGDNASYPPPTVPAGGGPETYPSMPPPAYSTAVNQ